MQSYHRRHPNILNLCKTQIAEYCFTEVGNVICALPRPNPLEDMPTLDPMQEWFQAMQIDSLILIISNGDFPKKPLKHLLFLALKSKEMVECQEEGYQLHISNHRPSLASAGSSPALHTGDGSLKIIAARKLAGGGK